jgi:hypothetical protein
MGMLNKYPAWVIVLLVVGFLLSGAVSSTSAQSTAAVTGIVFEDLNGNGQRDSGEEGLANVVLVGIEEGTGSPITATTEADGSYRLEAAVINHRIRVDESSLPFNGELTTSRLEYNLNVPPDYFAVNVNFGYQEVQPANAYGTVFDDRNGNGVQDDGEPGLSGVSVVATHDETGAVTTLTTDANGDYNLQATPINHRLRVDTSSLPFNGQLTTGREEYNLNIPPDYFSVNINFGYQEVQPANAYGTVFNDQNGNGQQDENEPGLSGVIVVATHDETGAVTTLTTDANGEYNLQATPINHRLQVDTSTLPFNGQLTTGREEYNLSISPDWFAPGINFGYQEVEPANVYGTVFNDQNGNGVQDDGEPGLSGVTIQVTHDETGAVTALTTDANGDYNLEATPINHNLRVDTSTLPFTGQLTTGREEYNLNIPPGFFAPSVPFGYQEVQPSVVSGTVFHDLNDNGAQDDNEPGLPEVGLEISLRSSGETLTITTGSRGSYRFETPHRRFSLSVQTDTLPFADPILTTTRETYTLNIPNGFIAPNVHFGYRAARSSDYPPVQAAGSGSVSRPYPFPPAPDPDNLRNPLEDPDPELPLPEELPSDAGEYALPREGTWTNYNGALSMTCSGMSFDQPPAPPETVTLRLDDGGRTLIGTGFEGGTNTLTASGDIRGLYTGTITITESGASVVLDFYLQVLTPEQAVGYLTGEAQSQGVSCQAYRPFTMEYAGS